MRGETLETLNLFKKLMISEFEKGDIVICMRESFYNEMQGISKGDLCIVGSCFKFGFGIEGKGKRFWKIHFKLIQKSLR